MAQKKRSVRSGVRLTNGKVAHPTALRRNEIVEEVVNNLRPWKNHKSEKIVTAAVHQALEAVLRLAPFEKRFFNPKPAREHAKKLEKAISKIETLLHTCPGTLSGYLFAAPPPRYFDDVRYDGFFAELTRLRKVCTLNFGYPPNYDPAKHLSAQYAYDLMRDIFDGKITGVKDRPFRIIAALLFEAISGQPDSELKRACDSVLRRRHKTPI